MAEWLPNLATALRNWLTLIFKITQFMDAVLRWLP